ncbi:PREDICTED: ninein [Nanorana parkeri]|uniref:ninein n=1 Tax=Nanorana parkeri TaxID=125878 RepID=UPI000854C48B|nr:PREDICTED: ninein [Nanorana parkeri]
MEQDQYEARLKELFDSFDTTGTGSLGQEELTDLCHMLQLEEVAPSLQQALLQDNLHSRVHFDQFKEALIDVLSSTLSNKENCPEPDCSLEAQPKYIKDGKRYGRRTVPELQDSLEEFDEETVIEPEDDGTRSSQVSSRNCEELWKNEEGEEYEAEGQLRFWNPDDLNASQTTLSTDQDWVEQKLQLICEDLGITRDGHLHRKKLLSICEQYGFQYLDKEALEDAFQNVDHDETMSLQDFFYEVCKNTKPPTPSSSTPYRQLKRHLSLQPYDESGRRTLTPSAMSGTIGLRLFSKLDDGTGYGCVEDIIDLWLEEGLDNSQAILKALDFSLEGRINLSELTMTLENELLITKNEIYHAALVSFRSEIRHLLEKVDQTAREKEKLRLDLEKNEKQKNLMALEVDDHHAAIERRNEHNLKKLDEEYKERTAALKNELRKEREQMFQQANRQRQELEQDLEKVRVEENYLRDRLTLSIKENTRMENELLETTEKLVECESLTAKLQRSLDFGDLDPSYVEFFRHEEKLLQLRNEYERQRRELQDRIDELQLELEDYRAQGVRGFRSSLKNSLFDEMDNKSSVECDQGIGSEDCPPLNMSIEAEMAIEQMREQHQREVEKWTLELENKTMHYEEKLKDANHLCEKEQEALKEKLDIQIHKAEEQIKIFKMKHLELEADIQRLKEEQHRAEFKHQDQVSTMEAEFSIQKQQLMEKESTLQLQLEEARHVYHKEKEELVQRSEDIEKEAEARLVELVTTYEDQRNQLEQHFHEQISSFQEKHELDTQEVRRHLLEQHQQEAQAQRKEMEAECNRRILEIKSQFAQDLELAEKTYKDNSRSLERRLQNDFQDLHDQHAEEKAQWAFEKEELLQEHIETRERLMENISQEKDALEKSYKELFNNLNSEKKQMENELNNLRAGSKQIEDALAKKVLQLESDLREELTERDEQLCQAEKEVLELQETLEKLQKQSEFEKDELCSKLSTAEELYKKGCKRTEEKRLEMMEEITKLQNTIHELKDETTSLSNIQTEFKLMEKENSELKNVLSQFHNCPASLEEERHAYRNLQNVHEQMLKENLVLQSEISRLKKNLNLAKIEIDKAQKAGKLDENKQALTSSEMKLKDGNEKLSHTKNNIQSLEQTIEKMEKDNTVEKQILQTKLLKSEERYKELYDCTNAKRQEMLLEIDRLQSIINQLQNEISSLSKTQQEYLLVMKENEDLKKDISQIQGNMVQEEERSALKNLQKVHEKAVHENVMLLSEISKLKKLDLGKVMEEDKLASEKLLHDLQEKSEQVCQAEKDVQVLHEALETVEQDRIVERECFNLKRLQSEEHYKVICSEAQKGRGEILRLKGTVKEMEDKVASLLKIQDEHLLIKKENYELKLMVSELQNTSAVIDGGIFRNLQTAHEQTVKENVRLLTEVSKLQMKLSLMENKTREAETPDELTKMEDDQPAKPQPEKNIEFKTADIAFEENKKTFDSIHLKLQKKTRELEDTTKVLCQLETSYRDVKTENDHLKIQVVLIQDKLNNLSLEYDQVKKAIRLEEIVLPELNDAPISIPGLKLLLAVAKKENLHLQKNMKAMELRNMEAVENNRTLSAEVSWLQNEIQNMEEITEASLKLENLYDETKKENEELKSLVHMMQKKICVLETKPLIKPLLRNKGIQTDLQAEESGQSLKYQECPLQDKSSKPLPPEGKQENGHIWANGVEYDKHSEESLGFLTQRNKEDVLEKLGTCLNNTVDHEATGEDKMMEHLRAENLALKEEYTALGEQVTSLKEEEESSNQKMSELLNACEEMWENLETIQNEKFALEKMVSRTVTELKSRNEQLLSENEELFMKNSKNQENLQDLNCRLMMFLKQKERKDSAKGVEEWQKEKGQLKEEIEGYRSKVLDSEQELSQIKVHSRFLEQENTLLRQEIETKELAKCSEITDLKNEISLLKNKNEKLLKEVETLGEELGNCVGKSAKVTYLENKIASLKQEQKSWEQQSNTLRSQLATSQEKIQNLEESLQNVNLQMSRIKSDLRVAQQEKESLKQEVMSLHKQLQNANTKKQVLEMAIQSSGLQNQQKKQYWDDLEQLMEQEQQLLRQENERLQREVHNTKSDLAQTREKVRQLESTVISLKHQKQGNQSSLVKALEHEKSSLKRECDQLQLELTSANRKISQLSSLEREMGTLKIENESLRKNQGKLDDHLMEMLHSPTSLSHSHSQLQQQACATVPRDHYLQIQQQLQQAERSNQQLRAALDNRSADINPPQVSEERLLRKMEARMIDVEQKLRIVKMLLQEKVNQLKEQVTRNSTAESKIKDLFVENSQLLKALELSKQRQQTAEKKNYFLEEKISGLSKIVRDLSPDSPRAGHSRQRRP